MERLWQRMAWLSHHFGKGKLIEWTAQALKSPLNSLVVFIVIFFYFTSQKNTLLIALPTPSINTFPWRASLLVPLKLYRLIKACHSTYSRQKFSGLSWMVKRHYIQDYSENFRGNTETRTVASDFIRPSIESSLTRRGKKRTDQAGMWTCGEGRWPVALMEIGWSKIEKIEERKNQWRIAVVCTINKICTEEKTSRDISEKPQKVS